MLQGETSLDCKETTLLTITRRPGTLPTERKSLGVGEGRWEKRFSMLLGVNGSWCGVLSTTEGDSGTSMTMQTSVRSPRRCMPAHRGAGCEKLEADHVHFGLEVRNQRILIEGSDTVQFPEHPVIPPAVSGLWADVSTLSHAWLTMRVLARERSACTATEWSSAGVVHLGVLESWLNASEQC